MHLLSNNTLEERPGTLAASLVESFGPDTARDVIDEFRVGWEMDKVMAGLRQQRIAQSVQRLERCTVEGLGQHRASIDLAAYMYWHLRTKGECWKSNEFIREYLRDNPECRVRYKARKTVIRFDSAPDCHIFNGGLESIYKPRLSPGGLVLGESRQAGRPSNSQAGRLCYGGEEAA